MSVRLFISVSALFNPGAVLTKRSGQSQIQVSCDTNYNLNIYNTIFHQPHVCQTAYQTFIIQYSTSHMYVKQRIKHFEFSNKAITILSYKQMSSHETNLSIKKKLFKDFCIKRVIPRFCST